MMEYGYDVTKDGELRQRRGVGFDDVVAIFSGAHLVTMKSDDPEQYHSTWPSGGWVNNYGRSYLKTQRTTPALARYLLACDQK